MGVAIKYKGSTIASMNADGTKTLKTAGKYCEGDIGVEYSAPTPTLISKSINSNGTYAAADDNADGFREVEVSVIDRKFVDLVQRTATRISDSDALTIGSNAFYSYSTLESVNFDNVIDIGASAFQACGSLNTIEFQNLQNIGFAAFRYCSSLTTADFPNVTAIRSGAFQISGLRTLILHRRARLSGDPMLTIPTSCIVYVENSDLEWYSTATNWSAIYADGRIKSIDELPPTGGST